MSLYEIFYNTGYGSDITVKYGNMELKVHKNVLIKHSGYFEAMIPHCEDIIDMSISDIDLDPVWLEKLIKSWYTQNTVDLVQSPLSYLEYYRYLKMWEYLICNGEYPCFIIDGYSIELRHDSMGIYSYKHGYKYFEQDGTSITNFINKIFGFKLIKNVVKSNKANLYIYLTNNNSILLDIDPDCWSTSIPFITFVPFATKLLENQ